MLLMCDRGLQIALAGRLLYTSSVQEDNLCQKFLQSTNCGQIDSILRKTQRFLRIVFASDYGKRNNMKNVDSSLRQSLKKDSFIFTVYVKSVPLYHFKLAYVVLQMAVKEFFENHF